jgi:hypothetical protein
VNPRAATSCPPGVGVGVCVPTPVHRTRLMGMTQPLTPPGAPPTSSGAPANCDSQEGTVLGCGDAPPTSPWCACGRELAAGEGGYTGTGASCQTVGNKHAWWRERRGGMPTTTSALCAQARKDDPRPQAPKTALTTVVHIEKCCTARRASTSLPGEKKEEEKEEGGGKVLEPTHLGF